jgi:hypothetical protein
MVIFPSVFCMYLLAQKSAQQFYGTLNHPNLVDISYRSPHIPMSDHVAEFIFIQRLIFDRIQAASAIDLGTLSTNCLL